MNRPPRAQPLQALRSLLFVLQMYGALLLIGLLYLPWALWHRHGAVAACHAYAAWVRLSAHYIIGLRSEIRGAPPKDEVLIAAKHQSFFDILMIYSAVPQAKFIMKKELTYVPILGWYARRLGCVPVDRGKRGAAITAMMAAVKAGQVDPGQLVIYPQGTRVAPGVKAPYKIGVALIYAQLGQACVPVATNVGHFWPRRSFYRRPGTAVVEFLPALPPGLPQEAFMAKIESAIETASEKLAAEAEVAS